MNPSIYEYCVEAYLVSIPKPELLSGIELKQPASSNTAIIEIRLEDGIYKPKFRR